MEKIFAYIYLWAVGFISLREYSECLDALFSENPDDELLLDLECCSNDRVASFSMAEQFISQNKSFNQNLFGKALFKKLELLFESNTFDLYDFSDMCYRLWHFLPYPLQVQEPFFTLCYADDCLSFGDEKQTKDLLKKTFEFYRHIES